MFQNANRGKLQEDTGSKDFKILAVAAAKLWKSTTSVEKAVFEKESERQKAEYKAYVATDEGKKALKQKKEARKHDRQIMRRKVQNEYQKRVAKKKRECNVAMRAIIKDDRLKKPTAYCIFVNENRQRIYELVGGNFSDVGKKAGDMWKKQSKKEKALYEARAKKGNADYDAYVATPEGAAVHPHVL